MKFKIILLSLFATLTANAQDSLVAKKRTPFLNHEIGFNTIYLIKQVISNNPSATLPQLPYSLFYNIYYKNIVGVRLGVGATNTTTKTAISGQVDAKTNTNKSYDLRAGLSYNFIKQNRLTANVFADFIVNQTNVKNSNTTTAQVFPNPQTTLTVNSTDVTKGQGAQAGIGVKYKLLKNLSLYAEVPISYITTKTTAELSVDESGVTDKTTSTSSGNNLQITLPTTVYLVLTF
jgi:opacity protein-like surface antigen